MRAFTNDSEELKERESEREELKESESERTAALTRRRGVLISLFSEIEPVTVHKQRVLETVSLPSSLSLSLILSLVLSSPNKHTRKSLLHSLSFCPPSLYI